MQKTQGTVAEPKSKRSTPARSSDAIKVSTRDGQSYADILKEMKAKVDPRRAELEVLSKRGETFRPSVRSSTGRSGKGWKFRPWSRQGPSKLGTLKRPLRKKRLCLLCALLQLNNLRIGWVKCRIREDVEVARCFRCLEYGHGSRGCSNPDRKDACWRCGTTGHLGRNCKLPPRCMACSDRVDKDVAYISNSGSCPVFREEFQRLRGRN